MSLPDPDALLASFRADLLSARTTDELAALGRQHTGRKSPLKAALKNLRLVPAESRKAVAQAIHAVRATIEAELREAEDLATAAALSERLASEWTDLTLPGVATPRGARHPITMVERRLMDFMRRLGFEAVEGPQVEHPFYNFDALNIPEHHPARDMQDTFWVTGGYLLRSNTTTVQARVLEQATADGRAPELPIRIVAYGRVYRNEAVDATHTAMFNQFECIWVDRGLTFAHLKGTLRFLAEALFGRDRPIRFKPKFYPYTEPSVGLDIQCGSCHGDGCPACHDAGWVTILGAGMIHPVVFRTFGFDPDEVSGIAFGMGTSRMAAQAHGVSKSKSLYEQDVRVFERIHRGGR